MNLPKTLKNKPMKPLLLLFLILTATVTHAQTKVFNEVAEDISSQLQIIRQDGNLVGYLVFTQLEKASADSFNYRLSIMDENLNDIGTVNFKEEKLILKAVSFEQDVICLVYVRSNFVGKEFRNNREFRREKDNAKAELFAQFVNLHGQILGKYTTKMDVKPDAQMAANSYRKVVGNGKLKQQIQLRNITGKGFACFYGDDSKNSLLIFNTTGKLSWQKLVKEDATDFLMLTSGPEVSLLLKKKEKMEEGGFEIVSYNTSDSTTYPKFLLKDKKGNSLKVLAFENDPITGKPYVSGLVIDPEKGNSYSTGRNLRHGPYCGVFSIEINGHKRNDIVPSFSYWGDGSQGTMIDKNGYYEDIRSYADLGTSFKDFGGNTYFAGSGIHRRFRTGGVITSVLLSWTLIVPMVAMAPGTHLYNSRNVMLVKQDPKGKLSLETTVPVAVSGALKLAAAKVPLSMYDQRSFYPVTNTDTKTNYLVIDDYTNIFIYDVNQKKVSRTIAHKDGKIFTAVFPAKEGHVMVSEYNAKAKQTRLSIEAL
jgi:hypothetical protein